MTDLLPKRLRVRTGGFQVWKTSAFAPSELRRDTSAFAPSELRRDTSAFAPSELRRDKTCGGSGGGEAVDGVDEEAGP